MAPRYKNPLAEAAGLAACRVGLHLPPNRRGKCPRCKTRLDGDELLGAGLLGMLGMFVGELAHHFQVSTTMANPQEFDPYTFYPPLGPPATPAIDWRTALGFNALERPNAHAIKNRYRVLAWRAHPDHGGKQAEFVKLTAARDAALKEMNNGS